ncbi:hypothetical protein [Haladaptatus sp. R4]|uniref:hypothetical protein n=1 Tax=Haladaptatus sp. R4 TaxID=1679489 RepID=UPI001CC14262|nr:hypothetical protein [Haladaptatus sp. R4]
METESEPVRGLVDVDVQPSSALRERVGERIELTVGATPTRTRSSTNWPTWTWCSPHPACRFRGEF